MLLYISASENETLFSDYAEAHDFFMDFIPLDEIPSLKTALARNRAMPNYKDVLFHFTSFPLPEDDILASVGYLQRFHHARIIIFAPEGRQTTEVFGKLADMGLRELVSVGKDTDLFGELEECLSPDGKSFAETARIVSDAQIEIAKSYLRPKLEIPEGFTLTVGITGTQNRVGVTTQAFGFYHALKALGFSPCVVDTKQAFIENLMVFYEEETAQEGSIVKIRGIDFASAIQAGTGHNAFILDCGVLSNDCLSDFERCSLRLLCSGAKAWELPHLISTLKTYKDTVQRIVFSFVPKNAEREAADLLGAMLPVVFAPWNSGIWEISTPQWYEDFLEPALKELIAR